MMFDDRSPGFKFTITSKVARDQFSKAKLTLDAIESLISEFTGWDLKYWKSYRKFILTNNQKGLDEQLKRDGFDVNDVDEDYPDVISLLDWLWEDEGLYELVCIYKLLLALNLVKMEDKIVLDLTEFD
jgi:hypothetical protein